MPSPKWPKKRPLLRGEFFIFNPFKQYFNINPKKSFCKSDPFGHASATGATACWYKLNAH
jgi:hypothetical protein